MALLPGSKFARIQELIDWGFNAPVYTNYYRCKFNNLYIINRYMISNNLDRVSIRIDGKVGVAKFSWINKLFKDLLLDESIINELPSFMISSGLPVALWSGCIMVEPDGHFILEVVRDKQVRVFTHGQVLADIRIDSNIHSDYWMMYPDINIQEVIQSICYYGQVDHCIYEFSIFPYPVGVKQEYTIFWEYEELNGFSEYIRGNSCTSTWGHPACYF